MDRMEEKFSNFDYFLPYFQSGNTNVGRDGRPLGPRWQLGAEVSAQSRRAQSEATRARRGEGRWTGLGGRRSTKLLRQPVRGKTRVLSSRSWNLRPSLMLIFFCLSSNVVLLYLVFPIFSPYHFTILTFG